VSIGFVSVGIALVIGVLLAPWLGFFGGWVDLVISRVFELIVGDPDLPLTHHHFAAFLKPSIFYTMIIHWTHGGRRALHPERVLKVGSIWIMYRATSDWPGPTAASCFGILTQCVGPRPGGRGARHRLAILAQSVSAPGVGVPADTVTWGSILKPKPV